MKKAVVSILTGAAIVLGLTGCNVPSQTSDNKTLSAQDFYAYGVASAGGMIAALDDSAQTVSTLSSPVVADAEDPNSGAEAGSGQEQGETVRERRGEGLSPMGSLTEEQLDLINNQMPVVESLLKDGAISHTEGTSDRPDEYAFMSTISYYDWNGNLVSYVIYYNETWKESEQDRDRDQDRDWDGEGDRDRDRDEDRDDDDEIEETYGIEGILIVDEAEYPIVGKRETETEDGETETELKFVATVSEGNYIEVKEEREADEQKLVYSVYRDGRLYERTEVEYEQERRETELEVERWKEGVESEISFEQVSDGDVVKLEVEAQINGQRYEFLVSIVTEGGTQKYVYEFADGTVERHRFVGA